MPYATEADYNRYGDGVIPADQLERALNRASDQIDSLTFNRIVKQGFDRLTPYQQDNIKKAVCQQADFTFRYGEYLSSPLSSFSAGSVSLSFKVVEGAGGVQTTEEITSSLRSTGLSNRGLC